MMNVHDRVKNILNKKNVQVPREWVEACIDWLQQEHADQPQNTQNSAWLSEKAYEQWLHTDLTELGTGPLSVQIKEEVSTTLPQDTVLQINSVQEVGLPAYSQLQQLRKDDIQNSLVDTDKQNLQAWEPKPTRMLLLMLTDGAVELRGMEYTPMRCLSLQTQPGTKMLVRAGASMRRGVLLLTEAYVTVMGGLVDSLLVANAPENIINRALGLEETDSPREYEQAPIAPSAVAPSQPSQYYPTQGSQPRTLGYGGAPVPHVTAQRNKPHSNTRPTQRHSTTQRHTARGGAGPSGTLNNTSNRTTNSSQSSNNFTALWNDSQAFGGPANLSQQSTADQFDEDDFNDAETEAALLEAEASMGAGDHSAMPVIVGASQRRGATSTVPASGSRGSANRINISGRGRGCRKPTTQAIAQSLKNNPFVDADFPDDDFEEDFSALEEEVKLLESQQCSNDVSKNSSNASDKSISNTRKGNKSDTESSFSVPVQNSALKSILKKSRTVPVIAAGLLPSSAADQSTNNLNSTEAETFSTQLTDTSNNSGASQGKENISKIKALHSSLPNSVDKSKSSSRSDANLENILRLSVKRPSSTDSGEDRIEQLNKQSKLIPTENSDKSLQKVVVSNKDTFDEGLSTRMDIKSMNITDNLTSTISTQDIARDNAAPTQLAEAVKPKRDITGSLHSNDKNVGVTTAAVQSKPPFTYLCFLPTTYHKEQEFVVKGFVMTLVSRLDPSSGEWKLPVKINDGSCSLDVDIHDKVLRQLIGLSVPEMRAERAKASTDPSIKAMLNKSVSGCQRELISLCCLLAVRVSPGMQRPLLVSLTPVQEQHAVQLAARCAGS